MFYYGCAGPDLDMRGGGGWSSRPLDKEGGVGTVSKKGFGPFEPQFYLKIRGAQAPPLDPLLYGSGWVVIAWYNLKMAGSNPTLKCRHDKYSRV